MKVGFVQDYTPWNKGLTKEIHPTLHRWSKERKGKHYSSRTETKKGQRLSPKTEFKTSHIPWNKEKEITIRIITLCTFCEKPFRHKANMKRKYCSRVCSGRALGEIGRLVADSEKHNKAVKLAMNRPIYRARRSKISLRLWKDSNYRSKTLTCWKDPDYKAEAVKRLRIPEYPTKLEISFDKFLQSQFLGVWKYVGNKSLIIGGLCPDWISADKKVIELFSCYWHGCSMHYPNTEYDDPKARIKAFNELGYECLVIWEHELPPDNALIEKIGSF